MASKGLTLGSITLPEETVTETFAILGKRGSGKTTTARVVTEELLTRNLPVVVLDPTGVWWGLRSSADGKAAGYPVVIFGGDHADVPLEENAGALVADVIVDERIPAVIDLSLLSKSAARRFAIDFLERLYHRNRDPLHVVIDEADLFAPQRLPAGAERLLGAMDDLVRRGRVRGLGVTLITQRPAVLNKDVLTQAEVLIALRMTGTRDVNAINEWVALHADEDEARTVKSSLPSLPVGTAWVWSPGWLGLLERVEVQRPSTFDSSATPKPGQRRSTARQMAEVDLAALGERITAAAERAKEKDPKELRQRITRLEKELAAARAETPEPERVEVPVLTDDDRAALQLLAESVTTRLTEVITDAGEIVEALDKLFARAGRTPAVPMRPDPSPPRPAPRPPEPGTPRPRPIDDADPGKLSKAERAILNVLAVHGTRTVTQVAILTGYSHKSGGYRNSLSSLRSKGYIEGRGDITATPEGLEALGGWDDLPTGGALRDWWKTRHLGRAESMILDVLADAWPHEVPVDQIAERTGYSATSGGFRNALSRLRSLELAAGRGGLIISDTLMGE